MILIFDVPSSVSGPKPMQDGWGNGGEEMGMSSSQWDTEDGDMWNSPTSQESSSSCNSWGNGPKKGPSKVRMHFTYIIIILADINGRNYCHLKKLHCWQIRLQISCLCRQVKMGNKPDEAWIMNRLIKQLTDMGFPVWRQNI